MKGSRCNCFPTNFESLPNQTGRMSSKHWVASSSILFAQRNQWNCSFHQSIQPRQRLIEAPSPMVTPASWKVNQKAPEDYERDRVGKYTPLFLGQHVNLRMLHIFVPILMDMFNYQFAQRAIPGSITKGVITLLKKGGRHVWEDLDGYRPITLLNTELKILATVLANHLQLVISDLIEPEQNYAVKGRLIQDGLPLVHEILERLKDDTKAAMINLGQS